MAKISKSDFRPHINESPEELSILAFNKGQTPFRVELSDIKGFKYKKTMNLTPAQIATIGTTGITVLPARAGATYDIKGYLKYFHKTTAYSATSGDPLVLGEALADCGVFSSTQSTLTIFESSSYTLNISEGVATTQSLRLNQPVKLFNYNNSTITGGDGTVELIVYYNIITF